MIATDEQVPESGPILEIPELTVDFSNGGRWVRAVDHVSLRVLRGECVCLTGESGCGKTTTALAISRLLPVPPTRYASGSILVGGEDVLKMSEEELRRLRGRIISYVFQEGGGALNPVFRVGTQVLEGLRLHRPAAATASEVVRLLRMVGVPAPELTRHSYPRQLSGGTQQRVAIAVALASQPSLLIADEPTAQVDPTIQAQIVDVFRTLKRELGMSILLITHNFGIVSELGDRVAVMYAGQVVESARTQDLLDRPLHPYTQALIRSVPGLREGGERLAGIPGTAPSADAMPSGCRFHPRCAIARADCAAESPALRQVEPGRWVRCPYWKEGG